MFNRQFTIATTSYLALTALIYWALLKAFETSNTRFAGMFVLPFFWFGVYYIYFLPVIFTDKTRSHWFSRKHVLGSTVLLLVSIVGSIWLWSYFIETFYGIGDQISETEQTRRWIQYKIDSLAKADSLK